MSITKNELDILQPGLNAFAITPNDGVFFAKTRGLYVGVTGNVAVEMAGGNVVTFIGLAGGVVHPLQVIRVLSSGTTALNIIGII